MASSEESHIKLLEKLRASSGLTLDEKLKILDQIAEIQQMRQDFSKRRLVQTRERIQESEQELQAALKPFGITLESLLD